MTISLPTLTDPATGWNFAHEPRFFSISTLVSFHRCPRLFFYNYLCDLQHARSHPALPFGAAIHAALPELSYGDMETRFARAQQKFNDSWGDGDAMYADPKRNSFNAGRVLFAYLQNGGLLGGLFNLIAPPVQTSIHLSKHDSPWEVPFAFYLGDLPVLIIGRVDGIIQNKQSGELYALERKTASRTSSMLLDNFKRNPQTLGYAFALRLLGIPVVGTVIETILIPDPGKTARANPKYDTLSTIIPIPEHYFEEFNIWAYSTGKEIVQRFEHKTFPKHMNACASYSMFGEPGFPCKYMNLCEPEDWTVLRNLYKVEPYNPYEIDNAKLDAVIKQLAQGQDHCVDTIEQLPACIF